MESSGTGRRLFLAANILLCVAAAAAGRASAYYEDITSTWSSWSGNTYSTFHYELTRRLALGAGFSVVDAERIASADAAVDVGTFQGEFSFSPLVVLKGTPRFGSLHTYYHFPRRGLTNASGDAYPSGTDSCSYFTSATGDVCPGGVPEIDMLDRWAVLGTAVPSPVPTISVNGSVEADVAGRSLDSLGIYLHSLADSYSHQECMRLVQKRDHTVTPPQACQLSWHDLEYGPNPPNVGYPYTQFAARAVFQGLLYYRVHNGLAGSPPWDEATAFAFVDSWAALFASADRRAFAAIATLPATFRPLASPCRAVDTRSPGTYPISGGTMGAGESRSFAVPSSACAIPSNALAYSLNATVVPVGILGYLTMWPSGQAQPFVSTLNSPDGRIKANAAIVPAGAGGAVSAYVTDSTELILDVNGYFVPSGSGGDLAFYPVSPCRISDTRNAPGPNGGPTLQGGESRDIFPWDVCDIPRSAQALSLNYTVVPKGPLSYLTTWPAGQDKPFVSTLNSPTGTIVANAAIVPMGSGGQVSVYVTSATDVIVDVNGYFAPAGSAGALSFYKATPCRISDTRDPVGPFGGPAMSGGESRSIPVPASACNIPASARAYSLNATVVPSGALSYLTLWPAGITRPTVSTLNAPDGSLTSNAALVPAGLDGAIDAFVTGPTHLILDLNGYFAP